MNGCKVTTPAHTTAMGIYGALGYYESGPSRRGPGRYPECQPQAVDVCEVVRVRKVSWLDLGSMQGWALVGGGWGLYMDAMQPPPASAQDPSFLNLSSLSH